MFPQAGLLLSCVKLRFRQGSFARRALPRFFATMNPSDSLGGTVKGYVFPLTVPGSPWAAKGLSVPIVLLRHAPSLPTPESPSTAHTRCFMDGHRLRHIRMLGRSRFRITRPNRVRLRCGSCLRPPKCFTPRSYPPACLGDYMANGSFHGDLLSDHKTTIVSLTHPMNADSGLETGGRRPETTNPTACGPKPIACTAQSTIARPRRAPSFRASRPAYSPIVNRKS